MSSKSHHDAGDAPSTKPARAHQLPATRPAHREGDAPRVVFRKSGGSYEPPKELDTQTLPLSDQAELAKLLEASGLADGHSRAAHDAKSRDDFDYDLTITAGGATWSVSMDRKSLPPQARPLVDFLNRRAKYQPLTGGCEEDAP